MSNRALLLLLLLGLGLIGLTAAPPGQAADPTFANLNSDLPYQAKRTQPVTYDVDFSVAVTAPYHSKILKVWLPLPQRDAGQEVEEGELSTFPLTVKPKIAKEPLYGNQFAYFEFDHPEGAQLIRHKFKIKVWELHWNLEPAQVRQVAKWPDGFQRFLRSDTSVVVDERLRKLALDIAPQRLGPAGDLAAAMDWVQQHLKYDHAAASLQASSEHALTRRTGHCSDYHGFCAAVGRALGYPTRVTYGINTFPKNSPSHCKMEAFLPPYGWVSFDVSETQQLIARINQEPKLAEAEKRKLTLAANDRLRRGFRDNCWFLQTKGTDYDLAPPTSKRVPVVRTIYAEADGVALPDPDPANSTKREWAWMTIHQYTPDKPVAYPFRDWTTLRNDPKKGLTP